MPIARFQMPDGRIARFEVPDGTTPEAAQSMMEQHFASSAPAPAPATAAPKPETREQLAAAIHERGSEVDKAVGKGFRNPFFAGATMVEGANNWLHRKFGLLETHGAEDYERKREEEWRADPASRARGAGALEVLGSIASPPNMLLMRAAGPSGAGVVPALGRAAVNAGAGATGGALVPTSQDGERATNAMWGGVLGAGIPAVVSGVGKLFRGAPRTPQMQGAVDTARDAGYVLPPTELNPSPMNSAIEGLSGKVKTSQAASTRNQEVTNALARRSIGLPEGAPLTPEATKKVRDAAGQAYEAVRGSGQIFADDAYVNELSKLGAKYRSASESFPELAGQNPIQDVLAGLNKPEFNASHGVDMIGILRDRASKAYAQGDKELGKSLRSASEALEGLIERNLYVNGEPNALKAFQEARRTIAKTYTVEKALNSATGDVSASVIARDFERGKPLSGGLETIGRVGSAFPKATQALPQNYNAISPLDFAAGAAGAVHNPLLAGLAVARPGVRLGALSGPGQSALGWQPGVGATEFGAALGAGSRVAVPVTNAFKR